MAKDLATLTPAEAAVIAAHAGLPAAPERQRRLAEILPRFRTRCERLDAVDVAGVEFDFLQPR